MCRGQSISLHSVLAIAPIPHLSVNAKQTYLSQLKALLFESLQGMVEGQSDRSFSGA